MTKGLGFRALTKPPWPSTQDMGMGSNFTGLGSSVLGFRVYSKVWGLGIRDEG